MSDLVFVDTNLLIESLRIENPFRSDFKWG